MAERGEVRRVERKPRVQPRDEQVERAPAREHAAGGDPDDRPPQQFRNPVAASRVHGQAPPDGGRPRGDEALPGHIERVHRGDADREHDIGRPGRVRERLPDLLGAVVDVANRLDRAPEPCAAHAQRTFESLSRLVGELLTDDRCDSKRQEGPHPDDPGIAVRRERRALSLLERPLVDRQRGDLDTRKRPPRVDVQAVGHGEDSHAVHRVDRRKRAHVHLDEPAPRRYQPRLGLHRRAGERSGSGDRGGDANRCRILAHVALVQPEQVQLSRMRSVQRLLIVRPEHDSLGQRRPASGVQDIAAEDGAGPPRRRAVER